MQLVDRVFRGNENLLQQIDWFEGDVTDLFAVEEAMEGVSEVYHCAGLISFLPSDFRNLVKVNVDGTANMVNIALDYGVQHFCYVSSTAALGRSEENAVLTEKTLWKTSKHNSGYAISKYGAEREVWRSVEEGLNAFIVNPSIIIGPGDLQSGSTALFGEVWKGLKFYPTGSSGFVDVRDVTKAMILLMEKKIHSERYIINSENVSYRGIINGIADSFGRSRPSIRVGKMLTEIGWRSEAFRKMFRTTKPMITRETARNGQRNWIYSNEKIKKELGMDFIPLNDAIENTCRIFMEEFSNVRK